MEIPEGFANVRYIFSVSGLAEQMGFSIGAEPSVGLSIEDIADRAYSSFDQAFTDPSSKVFLGYTFVGTSVTKTVGGLPIVGQHLEAVAGTGTIGAPTCNLAVLVRKNTALGGRKNRGRFFMPPFNLDEDEVTPGGLLQPAFTSSQQSELDAFRLSLETADIPPVLFHSDPADAPTPILSFELQTLAATQRRRLR